MKNRQGNDFKKYLAQNIHNVHNQDIRQSYVNQIEKT